MPLPPIAARSPVSRTLAALSCLSLAWAAEGARACESASTRAVIQSATVASKFALGSQACDGRRAASGAGVLHPFPAALAQTRPVDLAPQMPQPGSAPIISNARSTVVQPSSMFSVDSLRSGSRRPHRRPDVTALPKGAVGDAAARAIALVPEVERAAADHDIDPLLLHAIAHVESRHNPDAVSPAGARGLMQVMPATARRFGVTAPQLALRNPAVSLQVGSAYLKTLQKRFDNELVLVVAAYNAGEGAVEKYDRRVPPYKETQGYVRKVMAHYRLLIKTRDAMNGTPRAPL